MLLRDALYILGPGCLGTNHETFFSAVKLRRIQITRHALSSASILAATAPPILTLRRTARLKLCPPEKGTCRRDEQKTSSKKVAPAKNVERKRPRSPSLSSSETPDSEDVKRAKTTETTGSGKSVDPETREKVTDGPIFSGKFDLYAMTNFTYQAKSDFSAQIALPDTPYTEEGVAGSSALCDPMECLPYDLFLKDIKAVDGLSYTEHQESFFRASDSERSCSYREYRYHQWWLGNSVRSWKIFYSNSYKRKGRGSGDDTEFAFWAVRARKDTDGKEIGLNLGG
ncbi:uncharacterized protein BT62DRAFT_1013820 [Guyanagaster necrorhizus]|uniref:Uncharacterized protein n=1 Tax=Guyanagaster necrorhizus TaxID=856835 RepID=A0A9P7VF25_9AGAR|nr:uncharacterized protein BT62DRAFT_1013820 [Guyanagaster necrorhizus MCA 3950]KAG7439524.1 hypothetical protein BT62DRAFT_1013820 [Guyanagaster necrorhizus MCA 3950]